MRTFDAEVAAERLLGLGEAAAGLGQQDGADGAQRARREALVVLVEAAHRVRVHQVRSTLRQRRTAISNGSPRHTAARGAWSLLPRRSLASNDVIVLPEPMSAGRAASAPIRASKSV